MTISPLYEVFYIEGMLFNTSSALESAARVRDELVRLATSDTDDVDPSFSHEEMLSELQNVVVHAAALSRYFWPVGRKFDDRGARLRRSLEVQDDSPLRSRHLRNGLEHFDERLDEYLASGPVGLVIPSYFGLLPEGPESPTHIFRGYYFDTGTFELLGNRFDIQPIVDEIQVIHERLLSCADNGGRLPPDE